MRPTGAGIDLLGQALDVHGHDRGLDLVEADAVPLAPIAEEVNGVGVRKGPLAQRLPIHRRRERISLRDDSITKLLNSRDQLPVVPGRWRISENLDVEACFNCRDNRVM